MHIAVASVAGTIIMQPITGGGAKFSGIYNPTAFAGTFIARSMTAANEDVLKPPHSPQCA